MANNMPPQLRIAQRGKYNRVLFEDLHSLDIRRLAKNKWLSRDWGTKHLIIYSEHKHVADLKASIKQLNIICRDHHRQQISLHQRYHHGWLRNKGRPSFRHVFICSCGRKPYKLYFIAHAYRCYRCAIKHGAWYKSQRQ